jgi:hypothetical protein
MNEVTQLQEDTLKAPALSAETIKAMIVRRYLAFVGFDGAGFNNERIITRPLAMVGHAGIGKSELPFQAAAEIARLLGHPIQVRTTNLQFCELPDFMGLPYNDRTVTGEEQHQGEMMTRHGIPKILPQDGFGIWFLDEPNRAGRDIRSGLLTLLQARQVNGVPIGKNWMVVLAMNPVEADGVSYEVSSWDRALNDRIAPVDFQATLKDFLAFITAKYGEKDPVVRWVRMRGQTVVNFKGEGRCTPRSLEFLIRAIRATGGVETPTFWEEAAAEIGMGAANAFRKFLMEIRTIKAEEIIDSYGPEVVEKIHLFEQEGRVDVLNALTDELATKITEKKNELGDLWPKQDSPEWEPVWENYPAFTTYMKNIVAYLDEASADLHHPFLLLVCDKFADKPKFVGLCRYLKATAPNFSNHYRKLKEMEAKNAAAQPTPTEHP